MKVSDIMTRNPASCSPEQHLCDAAKIMLTRDCGSVPVVDNGSRKVIGLLTDRDIAVRAVAAGKDPARLHVSDVMSHPVAVISEECDLSECVKMLEQNQIRRAPVVDHNGRLVGMVATADVARVTGNELAGELMREISRGPDIGHLP